jgi:long-chain fatty acid transport protein
MSLRIGPLALGLVVFVPHAGASGFALIEQSGSGLGQAYAGAAAVSEDASSQYYNPATLMLRSGNEISGALHLVAPQASLNDASASVTTLGGVPYTGNDGGNPGSLTPVPNLYLARDIRPDLRMGIGLSVPYGLSTDYEDGWIGRYHALESAVQTINLNPALAWRINPKFAVGAGISVQYIHATLTSAIDSGSLCVALAGSATCAGLGLTPGNAAVDSHVKIEGDDVSLGANLGLIYQPRDGTTLGVAWRSSIDHELQGDADFSRSAALNALLGASTLFTDTAASAAISLPETFSLSLAQAITPRLTLLADATWTRWSRFGELIVAFTNPMQPDALTTEDWQDTWRTALGLNYRANARWTLRSGIAHDASPIKNAQRLTPRIPDSDRIWATLGARWQATPRLGLDVGYAHIFIDDRQIDNTTEASIQQNLQGNYAAHVDILSLQANWQF